MSNENNGLLPVILDKLDSIEAKLDNHLERIAKVESDIHWLRGSAKIAVTTTIGVVGYIVTMLIRAVLGK